MSLSRQIRRRLMMGAVLAAGLVLAGCVHYQPLPLPAQPRLASSPQLTAPLSQLDLPGLKPHPLPATGLDETSVIALAVLHNPTLKAARLAAGVAQAQLLAAGLLPDPVLGAEIAHSSVHTGYTLNAGEDLQTLVLRGAARQAARAHVQQVNLNILWQEWQVAERARELFIRARTDARLLRVLGRRRKLLQAAWRRDHAALLRDDALESTVAADLAAVNAAEAALRPVQLDASRTRHQLDGLLGLQPGTRLHLVGPTRLRRLSAARYRAALAALPRRRADLRALQAGYASQEQSLRRAILAQFPALAASLIQERDPVEGVNSFGLGVTLRLPLFNRNRGQIAIQRATRALLRQQYQARLDQATEAAGQAWSAAQILRRQLRTLNRRLPQLAAAAAAARRELRQKNVNAALYVTLESNSLAAEAEAVRLRAALATDESSLRTLLALPFVAPH